MHDLSSHMGQRDGDASRSLCPLSRQITLLCTYFKNTESRQNCGQRIRALREIFFCGLNICDCNETGYLDQAIEVLRDIESNTVLVSEGTAQVKEVFEQVKVVVA